MVRLGLTQERFSYRGKYFQIPEMSIRPQPRRRNLHESLGGRHHLARRPADIITNSCRDGDVSPSRKPWPSLNRNYDHVQRSLRDSSATSPSAPIVSTHLSSARPRRDVPLAVRREQWIGNYATLTAILPI